MACCGVSIARGVELGHGGFDAVPMAHHCYLADGRLLCWYHTAATDHVECFRIGREPISEADGLALLMAEYRRRDGRLLGPIVEPRRSVAGMRSRGRRRR